MIKNLLLLCSILVCSSTFAHPLCRLDSADADSRIYSEMMSLNLCGEGYLYIMNKPLDGTINQEIHKIVKVISKPWPGDKTRMEVCIFSMPLDIDPASQRFLQPSVAFSNTEGLQKQVQKNCIVEKMEFATRVDRILKGNGSISFKKETRIPNEEVGKVTEYGNISASSLVDFVNKTK